VLPPITVLLVLGIGAILSAPLLWKRSGIVTSVLVLGAITALGYLLYQQKEIGFHDSALRKASLLEPSRAIVYGRISDITNEGFRIRARVEVDSLSFDSTLIFTGDVLQLTLTDSVSATSLEEGGYYKIFGTLEPLRHATNPYAFSYDDRLQEQEGFTAKLRARSHFDLYKLFPQKPTLVVSVHLWLRGLAESTKGVIRRNIADPVTSDFVIAVVLGDRKSLDYDVQQDFTKAGISHLLAISGFNVGIISLLFLGILRILRVRWRFVRIPMLMLAVAFYSMLVGLTPSVVRSLIMIELFLLALLLERKPDALNIISGAALLTLLFRPYDLFDVGFQLSYAAVFGILLLYPEMKRLFLKQTDSEKAIRKYIKEGALVSLSATLATLPITAFHFYQISLIGLLVNIVAIPLGALITAIGFLLIPVGLLSTWLGTIYGDAVTVLTSFLLWLTHLSAELPFSSIAAPQPTVYLIIPIILGIFYVVWSKSKKQLVARIGICVVLFLIGGLIDIPYVKNVLDKDKLEVLFFDVGQGDCILIHTPNGKDAMIDFGDSYKEKSAFQYAVLPLLKAENCNVLDKAFLTHLHRDHYGGLAECVNNIGIAGFYGSGEHSSDWGVQTLDRDLLDRNVPVSQAYTGDRFQLDSDVFLYVLNPAKENVKLYGTLKSSEINHGSLVLKLVYKNTSFLLLGDVEASDEERLVAQYGDWLHSDVVKVAHHGSKSSSSDELITASDPRYAVISVGRNNHFKHPHQEVLARWYTHGSKILRTDRNGAVLLQSDGREVRQVDWR